MAGRVIFHVDINAYFASAELLKNSALEGQPVAVAGLSRRSVVSTASYEARAYGVHSAMPLHEALRKCPDLIVVQGDYQWYEELSRRFFDFLRRYTLSVEPASIDEGYMDVTETIRRYRRPLDLAWQIQQGLYDELRLRSASAWPPINFWPRWPAICASRWASQCCAVRRSPKAVAAVYRSDVRHREKKRAAAAARRYPYDRGCG